MEVQEALQKRRSVRKFTDEAVPEEMIDTLLHGAVGFRETGASRERSIAGETWTCLELEMGAENDEN